MRAFSVVEAIRALCLDGSVRQLVRDDLAARYLRRVRKDRFELLVDHPAGGDASGLLRLGRGVEEADGSEHPVPRLDQVVAVEARQLAQAGHQRLADLARQLL